MNRTEHKIRQRKRRREYTLCNCRPIMSISNEITTIKTKGVNRQYFRILDLSARFSLARIFRNSSFQPLTNRL